MRTLILFLMICLIGCTQPQKSTTVQKSKSTPTRGLASDPSDATTTLSVPGLNGQKGSTEKAPYETYNRTEFVFPPEVEVFDDDGNKLPLPPPGHTFDRNMQACKGKSNSTLYAGGQDGGQYGFHLSLNDGLEPGFFKMGLDDDGKPSTDHIITQHHGSGLPLDRLFSDRNYTNIFEEDDESQFTKTYSQYIKDEGTLVKFMYRKGKIYHYKIEIDPFAQEVTSLQISFLGDVTDLLKVAREHTGNASLTGPELAQQIRKQVSYMGLYLDKLAEKTPKARVTCRYQLG